MACERDGLDSWRGDNWAEFGKAPEITWKGLAHSVLCLDKISLYIYLYKNKRPGD